MCNGRKIACLKIKLFVDRNRKWVKSMIRSKSDTDPYWYQVS